MAKSELTGIGPWRLLEVIGGGERAVVYRGVSSAALGAAARPMAVKVLHGVLAQDPAAVEAFLARARVQLELTRLDHPAIVPCRAVEVASGSTPRPYAVLELVDAVSLERLFPERGRARFSLEAGTNLLIGVMDALAAAANDKMAHGHLGPSDVLVHADGTVVVTGFGQTGDLRMDFLAVHRLAQTLNAPWLPEIDAWLDALVAERSTWKDARAARAAFPLAYTEAGKKALDRAVKGRRRKDQKALEAAAAPPAEEPEAVEEGVERPTKKARRPAEPMEPGETDAALREARWVALSVLAIVAIALVAELVS